MRRLLIFASTLVFFDVAFFAAIAPLLPGYVDEFGLSEVAAGILTAAYAAGTLVAALPAGFVASRVGPRRTVIAGLLLHGFSSLAFGVVDTIVLLDSARFVQGVAGALIWSGAVSWLLAVAPPERRGAVIGTALGMAVAGVLLGPLLGAIAASVGTEPVFGSMLVLAVGFSFIATRFPDVEVTERQTMREVGAALAKRPLLDAAVFVAAPSVLVGAVGVLVPLRIDDLGGSPALIAIGFIAGAAIEATLAPLSGRASDRVGRRRPYVVGLLVCAGAMIGVGLAGALPGVIAALLLVSVGAGLSLAPAMTMISDTAALGNLHQGFAAGLSTMAWAAGQVIGGVGGGAAATLTGNVVPGVMIAVLLLVAAAYAFRALPGPPASGAAVGALASRPTHDLEDPVS